MVGKVIDKAADVAFDRGKMLVTLYAKSTALVAVIAMLLVAGLFGAAGGAGAIFGGDDFPLPDEPDATQRVLMPPGRDPVVAKQNPSTVEQLLDEEQDFTAVGKAKQPDVPGWADVLFEAQDSTVDDIGIPWTVLAGLARVQSDFGRRSPYDVVDRTPNRDLVYGVPPGTEGSSGETGFSESYSGSVVLVGGALLTGAATQVGGAVPNALSASPAATLTDVTASVRERTDSPGAIYVYVGPGETTQTLKKMPARVASMMKAVKKDTVVYAVTHYDPTNRALSADINQRWATAATKYDNLKVVKWHTDAKENSSSYFSETGSPTTGGTAAMGRLIIKTIKTMSSSSGWVVPVKGAYVGTPFGKRGPAWSSGYHTGTDFPKPQGTPVYATRSGTVKVESNGWAGPNYVTIDHGKVGKNNLSSSYAHMHKRTVQPGQVVQAGEQVGEVGNLGNSFGPHLHFQIMVNGGTTVNPMDYVKLGKGASSTGGFGGGPATVTSDNDSCAVPTSDVPIGGQDGEGVGPFLLMPEHAAAIKSAGGDPQNACDSAQYVAERLVETGAEVYEDGDFEEWTSDDEEGLAAAKKLWATVIAASGLFANPSDGATDCSIDVSDDNAAFAIEKIWTCEASRSENIELAVSATADGKMSTVKGDAASAYLVSEALAVAHNFSKLKTQKCDAGRKYAGVFPLTVATATKYEATDRCDPEQNIRAAARAVLAGETVAVSSRPTDAGPFAPMIGGWANLEWSMGDTAAKFSKNGPGGTWRADSTCNTIAGTYVGTLADTLAAELDALEGVADADLSALRGPINRVPEPKRSGVCAKASPLEWAQTIALAAESADTTGADPAVERRYTVLAAYFADAAADANTTTKAVRGKDSMVQRLSTGDKSIDTVGTSEFTLSDDGPPAGAKAVEYAVGYGGVQPDWETMSTDVLEMANLDGLGVSDDSVSGDVAAVIAAAKAQIGQPYSWGGGNAKGPSFGIGKGAGTKGFDCSGLTLYAYSKAGVTLGRTTYAQMDQGKKVADIKAARPGDLVFWDGHVAMYLGNDQVIHAPRTGQNVKIVPVAHAGSGSVIGIRRYIEQSSGSGSVSFPKTADGKDLAKKMGGSGGEKYAQLFVDAGKKYNLDPALLAGVAQQESGFSSDVITCRRGSSAGAQGIMQFMPATASGLGVDACDPSSAVFGGAKYLRSLMNQFGSIDKALAAYNWGPGNVAQKGLSSAPAETRNYIKGVPAKCRAFGGCRAA